MELEMYLNNYKYLKFTLLPNLSGCELAEIYAGIKENSTAPNANHSILLHERV